MSLTIVKQYGLWARKRVPRFIRQGRRLGHLLLSNAKPSDWIPPELLSGCRISASRNHLVAAFPRGGCVAEVGTATGGFARHILAACDPAELHLIDIDFSQFDASVAKDPRVVIHKGLSYQVLGRFPDSHFDWIYIDADHSYDGVLRDSEVAARKVKPGGYLVYNDFAHVDPFLGSYGVHRAVVGFATANRWPFAWIAYEPNALYDVAIKRPPA